jgi:hypothetical protein
MLPEGFPVYYLVPQDNIMSFFSCLNNKRLPDARLALCQLPSLEMFNSL